MILSVLGGNPGANLVSELSLSLPRIPLGSLRFVSSTGLFTCITDCCQFYVSLDLDMNLQGWPLRSHKHILLLLDCAPFIHHLMRSWLIPTLQPNPSLCCTDDATHW